MAGKPDGPGIAKWRERVKLIHARERAHERLTSDEAAQRSLTVAMARRCLCADGPERFEVSVGGRLYCRGCRTNLDADPDPLAYVPHMHSD